MRRGLFQRGRMVAWLGLWALLWGACGSAWAVAYSFPGSMPPGCSGSAGTYSCGALTLGYGDTVTITGARPATITVNGDLRTDTSTINEGGSASDLRLVVTGTLRVDFAARITARVEAGAVLDTGGQATLTGPVSTTSGNVTLGYATVVNGSITTTSGAVFVANSARVTGNITSTSGAVQTDFAATVDGAVATAGAVTLAQNTVVGGAVTGGSGAVSVGYAARVNGTVSTTSGTISVAQAAQTACLRSTASASITLGYQATVAGVCCGSSCGNSCVVNNSTYAMPAACAGATPQPDHYELAVASSGVTCLPLTVTVKACANASSPCTSTLASVSGRTATLSASAGTLSASTVTFDANGTATTTWSHPGAADGSSASLTLGGEQAAAANPRQCCPNGSSCSVANSCSTTFNTAGFVVAASAGGAATTVPAQTAGTASGSFVLRAVRSGTSTAACAAALTGSTTVDWALQCQNPGTCAATNLLTLSAGSTSTIASNPATGVTATTAVTMNFDANGNAPFSFNYANVGQVRLVASKAVNGATLSGSTNGFVVRPAGFALTNIRQSASPNTANPGASSATGGVFVRAGEAFSATVTALTSAGAAAPSFGRENTPEGVTLGATLVLPAGGTNATLANATLAGGSFSNGVATTTTLAYGEVGVITLTPALASGSYLGAGAVNGTPSGNVGRFVPARFALANGSLTHRSGLACTPASTFTHLDETFRLGFTLTAQNTSGGTTANYSGAFARLDPANAAAWNLAGRDGSTLFTTAGSRLSLGSASGSFSGGVASVTLSAAALRTASTEGPFDAAFGVAPVDPDGVALASFDMASTAGGANDRARVANVALRQGRLRLGHAIGAADRPLALPALLQHWNGSAWVPNTLDSCTTVPVSAMSFGNLRRTLTAADTAALGPLTFSAGQGTLRLAAPGGGRSGTFDVALSLGAGATDASCLQPWTPASGRAATAGANLAYLRGAWCSSTPAHDPAARASFGLQRTQEHLIYRRENY